MIWWLIGLSVWSIFVAAIAAVALGGYITMDRAVGDFRGRLEDAERRFHKNGPW